ncbi:unnamed protein product [Arabidopsis halleri]
MATSPSDVAGSLQEYFLNNSRSASKLASTCGQARSISAVVNRPSLALNPSPLRPFVSRRFYYSEHRLLGVIDSKILSALKSDDLHYIKETIPESFPFNIEDDPRAQFVRFTGENVREEHVQVLAFMPSLVADEPISIKLIVTVTKKSGLCLEFSCTASADSINIDIVSVNHPGGFFEGTLKNDWHFKDMDNDLKKMFYEYLETVVEASTTNFLHKYMMSKLKREYLEEEMDLGSFPFRIEDDPGDQSVTMTRDYNEEHIKVSLGMPYLGADVIDAFGTRKDELSFPLVVTVTKKSGLSLEFTCEAYADYIDLIDLTVNYPEDSLEYLMETDWPRFK